MRRPLPPLLLALSLLPPPLQVAAVGSGAGAAGGQPPAAGATSGPTAPHSITFSKRSWLLKDSGGGKAGPGPNFFNQSNAAVDTRGRLHLRITPHGGAGWACAEVYAATPLGLGRYRWVVDTALSAGFGGAAADAGMGPHVVLGMFLYRDDAHELDIEFSRWGGGYGAGKTADYAVQPWSPHLPTALHWTEPLDAAPTYHQLDWSADSVKFESGLLQPDGTAGAVLQRWAFANASRIPAAEGMLARMNFWLFRGRANMSAGARPEVVIRSFDHTPLPALSAVEATAPARAACDSRQVQGFAIKSISGGDGPTMDVSAPAECQAACCAAAAAEAPCTGWSFTPITRGGCPAHGCCFLKMAPAASINAAMEPFSNFTTGCISFDCSRPSGPPHPSPSPSPPAPPPPAPPRRPLPFPYVTPFFSPRRTIFANNSLDALRDPTTAVWSAEKGGTWHVYSSSVVRDSPHCCGGYPGRIRHFSTAGTLSAGPAASEATWRDEGLVLLPQYNTTEWDSSGVFTPGIVKDCSGKGCKWYLFFGGVANQSGSHTESVGLAISDSAYGPFVRYPHNPVFSLWDENTAWCHASSTPARVDEVKATQVGGKSGGKFFAVKSVCANSTGLPVLYSPVDQSSWAPPYSVTPPSIARSPLFVAAETCQHKGFEEPTLYTAPDGLLHFIGHDHGNCGPGCKYAHYVSKNHSLGYWQQAACFGSQQGLFEEPNPIPSDGTGVFGGQIRPEWVDFGPSVSRAGLRFSDVSWNWTRPPSAPQPNLKSDDNEVTVAQDLPIGVDLGSLAPMNMMWQECVGSGHAALWSRADWREHLAIVSREIGFRFIRGHGILDNSVMFYDACPNDGNHEHSNPVGQPGDTMSCIPDKNESTGSYWDAFSAYDFMLSVGAKPIVELSFTPNPLVEKWQPGMPNPSECDHFHYDSCELPPTNLTRYSELIGKFVGALLDRYGADELRQWKFEVYNVSAAVSSALSRLRLTPRYPLQEADLHWKFQQYASMYVAAATALKSVDSALQVGGPASAQPSWVGLLMDYCKNASVPLDFVSTHAYPAETSSLESQMAQLRVAQRLADTDGGKPLLITEWSSGGTGWVTLPDGSKAPPMHDEWEMGAWILGAVLNATDTPGIDLAAYSYWALSDVFTEQGLPQSNISFSGNWGLVNIFGVRKPSFRAFQMLNNAGSTRAALTLGDALHKDLHAVALLDGKDLHSSTAATILVANHACRHICPEPSPVRLNISIAGIAADSLGATMAATLYRINATSGNPKAEWEKQGAPDYPSPRQIAAIHAASQVKNSTIAVTWRDGKVEVAGVMVEPYSLVAVHVALKGDDEDVSTRGNDLSVQQIFPQVSVGVEQQVPVSPVLLGPAITVSNLSFAACGARAHDDVDSPARAFVDATGVVHLVASCRTSRLMTGPTLFEVKHDCQIVHSSSNTSSPTMFADNEWIHSTYSLGGNDIFGLLHNEYHGFAHANCALLPSHQRGYCQMFSLTAAISHDGGYHWEYLKKPPHHLVATVAHAYDESHLWFGFGDSGGIVRNHKDNYFYTTGHNRASIGGQANGTCLMRTNDLTDLGAWRGWNGSAFSARFVDPYTLEPGADVSPFICHVLEDGPMGLPRGQHAQPTVNQGLTWSSYLNQFIAVLWNTRHDPTIGGGAPFVFALSDDLISWSAVAPLPLPVSFSGRGGLPNGSLAYPSLLDPAAQHEPGQSFDVVGRTPWLYFALANPQGTPQLDHWDALVRVPLDFGDAEIGLKSDDEVRVDTSPLMHTYLYRGTAEMRSNPERGFRHELHPDENGTLSPLELEQLKQFNLTVGQTYWYLPADPVLSEQTLQGVTKTLRTLRRVGVKALFRFAYDHCDSGPIGENNYTAATILGHIRQVKERFSSEIDVVYVLQAGFLGCWGEWHGARLMSDPFVFPLRGEVQQILHAELFELLPADRKMNLRYPALKFDVVLHRDCPQVVPECGGFPGTGPGSGVPSGVLPAPPKELAFGLATAANSKDNTAVSRLGFNNDYFMNDQTGGGAWVGGAQHDGDVPRTSRINPRTHQLDPRDGANGQIPSQESYGDPLFHSAHGPMMDPGFEYEKAESPYVPMDCEMDWLSGLPSRAKPENANTSLPLKVPAEAAAWRLREMHYSTMSLVHGYSHLDGTGKGKVPQPNNNETIDHWMQTTLNVTQASRDFRLPISPEYAAAGRSGFDYIRDHLGYRLELRSAVLPQKLSFAAAGENATFSFEAALINWGFAAPISPRPVQLVVLGSNGTVLWRSVSLADPRDWQPFVPGDPTFLPLLHRLAAAISIPSSALRCSAGQVCRFSFGLAMPDMRMEKAVAEGPAGGEGYCIRLANDAVPWLQGVNVLAEFDVSHGDGLSTPPPLSSGSRRKTDDSVPQPLPRPTIIRSSSAPTAGHGGRSSRPFPDVH